MRVCNPFRHDRNILSNYFSFSRQLAKSKIIHFFKELRRDVCRVLPHNRHAVEKLQDALALWLVGHYHYDCTAFLNQHLFSGVLNEQEAYRCCHRRGRCRGPAAFAESVLYGKIHTSVQCTMTRWRRQPELQCQQQRLTSGLSRARKIWVTV